MATPNSGPIAIDVFSAEQNPGKGYMEIVRGGVIEAIEFGGNGGHYGMGMVFQNEWIPNAMGPVFGRNNVIQIALGTVPTKAQGIVPQFGTITLLMPQIPTQMLEFKVGTPNFDEAALSPTALVLMTAPKTPQPQSDEEKLRGTYYSLGGVAALTPRAVAQTVVVESNGKRYRYRRQIFKFEIDAKISTPFNPQEALLRGGLEFPIYTSEDRKADALSERFLRESVGGDAAPAAGPLQVFKPARQVSGASPTPPEKPKPLKPRRQNPDGM